jgi:hypothetical protein
VHRCEPKGRIEIFTGGSGGTGAGDLDTLVVQVVLFEDWHGGMELVYR